MKDRKKIEAFKYLSGCVYKVCVWRGTASVFAPQQQPNNRDLINILTTLTTNRMTSSKLSDIKLCNNFLIV